MSILVNLTPIEEESLSNEAMQSGLATSELAAKLLREHLASQSALNPIEEMRLRIRKWQKQDNTPSPAQIADRSGMTPTAALFQQWAEEDADKTDEEIAANDRLWADYQQGIDEERQKAGMRTLF